LCRREHKGALNLRPRHSSGDTTIIPPERPRQSVANGQRERSCGSSPVRRGNREDFPFPGENYKRLGFFEEDTLGILSLSLRGAWCAMKY
jgi:hypothetical protein